jgi:hypothetical protein
MKSLQTFSIDGLVWNIPKTLLRSSDLQSTCGFIFWYIRPPVYNRYREEKDDSRKKKKMRRISKEWRRGEEEGGRKEYVIYYIITNLQNKGLISADRDTKVTLMRTIPRSLFKSYTKDLSLPIFELVFQHRLIQLLC